MHYISNIEYILRVHIFLKAIKEIIFNIFCTTINFTDLNKEILLDVQYRTFLFLSIRTEREREREFTFGRSRV